MWDRIVSATGAISKAVADKYVAIVKEDEDYNIDNEDQSKVSRVLREYYIRKTGCLPDWLIDAKAPKVSTAKSFESGPGHCFSSDFNVIESTKSLPVSFRDIYDSTPKHFESVVKSNTFNVEESRHRNLSASERLREKLSRRNMDNN
ncbi:hypothetical protein PMAC_002603 [Pneumocystis sp. 'macacae']|nr:hypothetical protein PMAC_002603 [Pneumocystis sp. 'macacae']